MPKKFIPVRGAMPATNFKNSNQSEIQAFNKSQIYFKGFNFGLSAGANEIANVNLGGACRRLYGITVYVQSDKTGDDDLFSLQINQEQIIDRVLWRSFCPTLVGNNSGSQFFAIPRPLTGSDTVNIVWNATTAKKVYINFYLSNSNLDL